jgi:hypothetical protein
MRGWKRFWQAAAVCAVLVLLLGCGPTPSPPPTMRIDTPVPPPATIEAPAAPAAHAQPGTGEATPAPSAPLIAAVTPSASATPIQLSSTFFTRTPTATATEALLPVETPTNTATAPPPLVPPPVLSLQPPASPTATFTATPAPAPCALAVQGLFTGPYQAYRTRLICPLVETPQLVQDAEQAFENGRMLWRADRSEILVLYEQGSRAGTFQLFVDTWTEEDPVYSCPATPPANRLQPLRGFGRVWCRLGGAAADIGWALAPEAGFGSGYGDPLVQDFTGGLIFRDSLGTASNQAYVFFTDAFEFLRVSLPD